jgi:hypothetical protein
MTVKKAYVTLFRRRQKTKKNSLKVIKYILHQILSQDTKLKIRKSTYFSCNSCERLKTKFLHRETSNS